MPWLAMRRQREVTSDSAGTRLRINAQTHSPGLRPGYSLASMRRSPDFVRATCRSNRLPDPTPPNVARMQCPQGMESGRRSEASGTPARPQLAYVYEPLPRTSSGLRRCRPEPQPGHNARMYRSPDVTRIERGVRDAWRRRQRCLNNENVARMQCPQGMESGRRSEASGTPARPRLAYVDKPLPRTSSGLRIKTIQTHRMNARPNRTGARRPPRWVDDTRTTSRG